MPDDLIQYDVADMPRNTIMYVDVEAVLVDENHGIWVQVDAEVHHDKRDGFEWAQIVRDKDTGAIKIGYSGNYRWRPHRLNRIYYLSVDHFYTGIAQEAP